MTPKLSPGAAQMVLPFMEKLALSPKAEQPFQQLLALSKMVGEGPAALSPWQRLIQSIPKYRSSEGLLMHPGNIRRGSPTAVEFEFKPPGQPVSLGGNLIKGDKPEDAYLSYMGSNATSRAGTGTAAGANEDFTMDIASPAQRALPLRGMRLPKAEKMQRPVREPEERYNIRDRDVAPADARVPLAAKQQAADRFLDVLRRAGFKNLSFSAEAGERPRLYEMITGYKAKPMGETDELGRISRVIRDSFPGRRPASAGPRSPQGQTTEMPAEGVESALGLSIDEAYDAGLVKEVGPHMFSLTEQGHAAARNWLGGSQ